MSLFSLLNFIFYIYIYICIYIYSEKRKCYQKITVIHVCFKANITINNQLFVIWLKISIEIWNFRKHLKMFDTISWFCKSFYVCDFLYINILTLKSLKSKLKTFNIYKNSSSVLQPYCYILICQPLRSSKFWSLLFSKIQNFYGVKKKRCNTL